ncbi:hypothetical protein LWX53_08755 [bacterium]|nr:hypothetical protein [bacterium]
MNGLGKRCFFALLAFIALAGASVQAQASRTAAIQIVAVVPAVLRLSLDFSSDATVQLAGYIPGTDAAPALHSRSAGAGFEIKPGAKVDLGKAKLLSNLSSCSVKVYSANGGTLRGESGDAGSSIPYQLQLGDAAAEARGGTFTFSARGRTTRDGDPLTVALAIDSVPTNAGSGIYTDQLMFAISAN